MAALGEGGGGWELPPVFPARGREGAGPFFRLHAVGGMGGVGRAPGWEFILAEGG